MEPTPDVLSSRAVVPESHPVRFTFDKEANALYVCLRGVAETIEIEDGINLDIDSEGFVPGMEFVYADDFLRFIERRGGGLDIPERVENAENFSLA
jgi:uncharacterized protein YuzE